VIGDGLVLVSGLIEKLSHELAEARLVLDQ